MPKKDINRQIYLEDLEYFFTHVSKIVYYVYICPYKLFAAQ